MGSLLFAGLRSTCWTSALNFMGLRLVSCLFFSVHFLLVILGSLIDLADIFL